jgi:hypothetical protein
MVQDVLQSGDPRPCRTLVFQTCKSFLSVGVRDADVGRGSARLVPTGSWTNGAKSRPQHLQQKHGAAVAAPSSAPLIVRHPRCNWASFSAAASAHPIRRRRPLYTTYTACDSKLRRKKEQKTPPARSRSISVSGRLLEEQCAAAVRYKSRHDGGQEVGQGAAEAGRYDLDQEQEHVSGADAAVSPCGC